MRFTKMEGCGNDYIYVSLFEENLDLDEAPGLAKAVSDANEAQLAARAASTSTAPPKKPGVTRVGVPELANKTEQNVDTRALRTQLIAELAEQKMEGVPLAAAPQADLHAYA